MSSSGVKKNQFNELYLKPISPKPLSPPLKSSLSVNKEFVQIN